MKSVLIKISKFTIKVFPWIGRTLLPFSKRFVWLLPDGITLNLNDYLSVFNLSLNTSFPIERSVYEGRYEPDSIELINQLVSDESICIDVGANMGSISFAMAKKSPRGKIVAFEPNPVVFERLKNNLNLNKSVINSDFKIHNVALGKVKGSLLLREFAHLPGNSTIKQGSENEFDAIREFLVPVVCLDEIVDSEGLTRIDFVKIDTELTELDVLKGFTNGIQRFKPTFQMETIQFHDQTSGAPNFVEIADLMKGFGYASYGFVSGKLYPVDKNSFQQDTIFIHKDKLPNLLPLFK